MARAAFPSLPAWGSDATWLGLAAARRRDAAHPPPSTFGHIRPWAHVPTGSPTRRRIQGLTSHDKVTAASPELPHKAAQAHHLPLAPSPPLMSKGG